LLKGAEIDPRETGLVDGREQADQPKCLAGAA
jgi:hypothetical protein